LARTPVDLNVDRVPSVTCARCTAAVDTSQARPLSTITCSGCGAPVRVPGRIGQFLLTRMLGRGAMGAVFEGVDEDLGRRVAIKVLTPRRDEEEDLRLQNLLAEARALARINHVHVVQIHSVGQHRDQAYIVMELVSGGPRLEEYAAGRDVLQERDALELLAAVAEGLGVAARAHLVHGDIKPQNILINAQGVAKVVDFGLTHKVRQTGGSTVWGTPYYIAPERARGGACDTRADIYSLGATVWHLLTGRPPFQGKTVREVVAARLRTGPPDVREVRPDVHEVTARLLRAMMAVNPTDRPASFERIAEDARAAMESIAQDASDALTALAASSGSVPLHAPLSASLASRKPGTAPRRRIPRLAWVALGAVVLAAAIVGGLALGMGNRPPPPGANAAAGAASAAQVDETFEGPGLPGPWVARGATPNGRGHLAFTVAATSTDIPQAERPIGSGDFSATLEFSPLQWNLNLRQTLAVRFTEGDVQFSVLIEKDRAQRPVVRLVSRAGADEQTRVSRPLAYDPRSLTLWIGWTESSRQWAVAAGIDAAQPRSDR
jgi:tRNA A-37 threonylcarbamoyl transferase component Bud32